MTIDEWTTFSCLISSGKKHTEPDMLISDWSKKTLLILGGGFHQVPVYEAAKKMGVHVIGLDRNKDAAARFLADEFYHIGIADPDLIIKTLNGTPIDGLISPAADTGHRSIYALSHRFNLPFKPSLPAVTSSMNKAYFLKCITDLNLPGHAYFHAGRLDELNDAALRMGYPLIVKPVDSSGSKGITLVSLPDHLETALRHAMSFSSAHEIILEQYIEGTNYGVEAFRLQGKTILLAVNHKTDIFQTNFETMQHILSPALPADLQKAVERSIDLICDKLLIADGPVNFDFILKDGKIFFHDIGARLGGNGLSDLVKLAYGLDLPELTIRLALGDNLDDQTWFRKRTGYAGLRMLFSQTGGTFVDLDGLNKLKTHPAFSGVRLFVKSGDQVYPFSHANFKLGYMLAAHADLHQVMDLLSQVDEKIIIRIKNHEN
ncbi:MAG: ATP-grasp domain-containing protein [Desulfobacteraceae bacterium]|nr:MAG: ATP-grasp domain-containing protein [Desulfobacteraceae bacterium]